MGMEKKSGIHYYESNDSLNIARRAGTAAGDELTAGDSSGSDVGHRVRMDNNGREDLDVLFPAYGERRNQAVNRSQRQAGAGTVSLGYRRAGTATYGSAPRGRISSAGSSAGAADPIDAGAGRRTRSSNTGRPARGYSYESGDPSGETATRRRAQSSNTGRPARGYSYESGDPSGGTVTMSRTRSSNTGRPGSGYSRGYSYESGDSSGETVTRRRAQSSNTGRAARGFSSENRDLSGNAYSSGSAVTRRRAQNRNAERTARSYSYENTDLPEDAEEQMRARRRRQREQLRQQRAREVRRVRFRIAIGAVLAIFIIFMGSKLINRAWAQSKLSDSVLSYRSTVEHYAQQEGVEDYVDTLLAIMMVESEGQGKDVMQSSESKGLARNSLKPEESIEQACIYYAALIDISEDLGIDDDKALIQAYNFGPGYLNYLAEHGGKHRQKYAIEYAKELSGGEKIRYLHLYAIRKNGGWIYKFGNMFYDALVEQYL